MTEKRRSALGYPPTKTYRRGAVARMETWKPLPRFTAESYTPAAMAVK